MRAQTLSTEKGEQFRLHFLHGLRPRMPARQRRPSGGAARSESLERSASFIHRPFREPCRYRGAGHSISLRRAHKCRSNDQSCHRSVRLGRTFARGPPPDRHCRFSFRRNVGCSGCVSNIVHEREPSSGQAVFHAHFFRFLRDISPPGVRDVGCPSSVSFVYRFAHSDPGISTALG